MKILFIGDIVARPGRDAVKRALPDIVSKEDIDIVIANAENLAHGRGVTKDMLLEMQDAGVDYFTSGDHVFWRPELEDIIDNIPLIRPANYPEGTPGKGFVVVKTRKNDKLLLINVMGRTFLNERINDPFTTVDKILSEVSVSEKYDASFVDFHAEATSEKYAFGFYFDGRVDCVVGTHTHVPTCDNHVLPKGTLFVSDVGMCGNIDSVLGVQKDIIINFYTTGMNQRFEWEEKGRKVFRSVLIDTQKNSIERFDKNYD